MICPYICDIVQVNQDDTNMTRMGIPRLMSMCSWNGKR